MAAPASWTPVGLAVLLVGGWLATIPIADRHGTDEPYPWTAFPMYSRVPGERAPFLGLVVTMPDGSDSGNATAPLWLDSTEALDARHRQRFGPARGAFESIRASYVAGCAGIHLSADERKQCDGDPAGFALPPEILAAWAEAAEHRFGSRPDTVGFAQQSVPLDEALRTSRGSPVRVLFTVDLNSGQVTAGDVA
jgi:hypothetical protein